MSGRNFCESGNFGSGEVLLGISGNRNFCWMQLFSRGYYQLFPKLADLQIAGSVGFWGI